MKELTGVDLWEVPADLRVISTNGAVRKDGAAVMGRGCARQARDRYPGVDLRLGRLLKEHGNRPFRLGRLPDGSVLASLPVKHHWQEPADLKLIHKSLTLLVELADRWQYERVILPRFGCGNGGLHWPTVCRAVGHLLLDDRFTVVHGGAEPVGKVAFPRVLWAVVLGGSEGGGARQVLNVFGSKGFAQTRVAELRRGFEAMGVRGEVADRSVRVEAVSDALGEEPYGECAARRSGAARVGRRATGGSIGSGGGSRR
jgi:hypothetical protein